MSKLALSFKKSALATVVAAAALSSLSIAPAQADATSSMASLALAQVGNGPCDTPGGYWSQNRNQGTSCNGHGGQSHAWCADFVGWIWSHYDVARLGSLTDGAASFYAYGQANGTLHSTPKPGDAVVFDYSGGHAQHVALVTAFDGNKMTVVGGNEGHSRGYTEGIVQTESTTSWSVGSAPWSQRISGYISPVLNSDDSATPAAAGMTHLAAGDLDGSGKQDIMATEVSSGDLYLYPGSGALGGANTLGARVKIGSGWNSMTNLTVGDYDGDGKADVLATDTAAGDLYLYPGSGSANGMNTLGPRVQIGSNWSSMHDLTRMDVNKDGKPDLVAVETATGNLYVYPGTGSLNGANTLGARVQIGTNWNSMSSLVVPGDLNSDSVDDLVAKDESGNLFLYPGTGALNGNNTLGNRTQIGSGWKAMTDLVGADLNNDGKGDIAAVQAAPGATGTFYAYPGTGAANGMNTLGARVQIGTNW
ncbi:FG-GAP-like repeat-containing protein [Streptomyces sp. NPDC098789]|uniref:FG-GAP-like repeat-containing protein n=1 Tax=Streptomyces sp. NPDC098789 TaxID=3366098 RepID=UPI0038232240